MEIQNESQITGDVAKQLRLDVGMSQSKFWGAIGKTQSNGHFYEEKQRDVPKPLRILIYATYVVGLKLDMTTPEGIRRAHVMRRAQDQHDAVQSTKNAEKLLQENRGVLRQRKTAARRDSRKAVELGIAGGIVAPE